MKHLKEDAPAVSTASVAGAGDDGIVVVRPKKKKKDKPQVEVAVDQRYRKDKSPVMLKRFSSFIKKDD